MTSFSPISFSPLSFSVLSVSTGLSGGKKRNRWRDYIRRLARDFRQFFRIKQREEPKEEVPIPAPQPPQTTTILAGPPTENTKLETLNDKWVMPPPPASVVASIPPKEPEPAYPLILNPITSPIIQKTVTLPRATKQSTIAPYRVGEGSHIESKAVDLVVPTRPSKSKAASTLNTLMILLELERQI